jgi:sugar fermentation stimulation protein A
LRAPSLAQTLRNNPLRVDAGAVLPQEYNGPEPVRLEALGCRKQNRAEGFGRQAYGTWKGHMALALGDVAFGHISQNGSNQRVTELGGNPACSFRDNKVMFAKHHVWAVLFGTPGWNDDGCFAGGERVAHLGPCHALDLKLGSLHGLAKRDGRQEREQINPESGQGVPPFERIVCSADLSSLTLRKAAAPGYQTQMKFKTPLLQGTLIQRYKRFLTDVTLADGTTITATCPNTGSMLGLTTPGSKVWISENDSPTRKYRHTWEMIETEGPKPCLVGINTGHPNALVTEAIEKGVVTELKGYASLRREVKYGVNSRIDILLEGGAQELCYVEIKNVHLSRAAGLAEFPDSKTERGVKHLEELSNMVTAGHRAVMVYLIQRADAARFDLARDIDPAYGAAFAKAHKAGVEMLAYRCKLSPEEIKVAKRIEIAGL